MRMIVLLFAVTVTLLLAYQKGDRLDDVISKKLGLEKDKIYVIDFFASWCGSCKKEMPYLNRFAENEKGKDIEVIGIDVDENVEEGKAFQQALKAKKSLQFKVLDDPKGEIIKYFDPIGMPAIYIVKNGKVEALILGAKDDIDKLLHEKTEALR